MSDVISVCQGKFGRIALLRLDRKMAPHAHRESHLIFHLDGPSGKSVVNNHVYRMDSDSCILINPIDLHHFVPHQSQVPCLLLVIYISPMWILEISKLTARTWHFGSHQITIKPKLHRLRDRLVTSLNQSKTSRTVEKILYDIYVQCFRASWQDAPQTEALARIAGTRVLQSLEQLYADFSQSVDARELARNSGLSRPHLFSLFKEEVGLTPKVYANILRSEQALKEIMTTTKTLEQIAHDLGFASQSTFSRFFSAHVGVPPSIYRRGQHLSL